MPEAVQFALLAVLVVLLLLAFVFRRATGRPRDLVTPDPASGGGQAEVLRLAREGRTVEAVKLLRQQTGLPLLEAKQTVDVLRAGGTLPARPAGPVDPDGEVRAEATRLVRAGKKIHAVKLVREHTSWSLAEAKRYVDRL
ncbi:50S ribosomal protein L7/L12 [Micromonospora sp. WMMC241]|uniref:50S ribosomal protein L7/L12 n=1 Tax=Micromonospora sp. WMMC241 TaxID=3015159 RepID=UPI0022B63F94|nr:50S ribosomal protein L7/L12 [Micromonospora sp. WMMC241]MCZ7439184.1 50S ribosomal protein L7/L12 [Micromonospora sp. WMMC241]